MSGNTNFPTALDTDSSLFDVTDGVSTLLSEHHNNMKESIKAVEAKVGIYNTNSPTSLDYRVGHPTDGHRHDGASGQGPVLNPSVVSVNGEPLGQHERWTAQIFKSGALSAGSNVTPPVVIGRTGRIENISAVLGGASNATAAAKLLVGPTNIWGASVGLGVRFAPGATRYGQPSPNLTTYASGSIITLDIEAAGSARDLSITFVFRD